MKSWSNGMMEWRSNGVMEVRKNKNRGYQKMTVWSDAIEYYALTQEVFRKFPYDLKRVAAQAIASADSIHRNTCPVK